MRPPVANCVAVALLLSSCDLAKQFTSANQTSQAAIAIQNTDGAQLAQLESASKEAAEWAPRSPPRRVQTGTSSLGDGPSSASAVLAAKTARLEHAPAGKPDAISKRSALGGAASALSAGSQDKDSLLPKFTAPIGNVTAVLGRDVRLVCQVENLGPYQVAWLRGETNTILSIDTNIIITNYRIFLIPDEEQRKWALHIKDVKESDSLAALNLSNLFAETNANNPKGSYLCQVNTSPTLSASGHLKVVVPPAIVQAQTSQMAEVVERSNVSLQCKTAGTPKPSVVWHRDDGLPVKLNGSLASHQQAWPQPAFVGTNQTAAEGPDLDNVDDSDVSQQNALKSEKLHLYDVDRTMAGVYVCTASNRVATPAIKKIPVYVKFPPSVSVNASYVPAALGEQVHVDCVIEAFPKANSYWSKKPAPQVHRAERSRWLASERQQAFAAALGAQRELKLLNRDTNQTSGRPSMGFAGDAINGNLDGDDNYDDDDDDDGRLGSDHEQDDHGRARVWSSFRQAHRHRLLPLKSVIAFNGYQNKPQLLIRDTRTINGSPQSASQPSKSVVSVMQTALNAYTYRLRLTIGQLKPDDFGEYSCVAVNALGSAEAQVVLIAATGASKQQTATSLQEATGGDDNNPDRPIEFRRNNLDSRMQHHQHLQQQQSLGFRRSSSGQKVVYDENYLQAIKTRQNGPANSSKLQQRLSKNNGESNKLTLLAVAIWLLVSAILSSLGP